MPKVGFITASDAHRIMVAKDIKKGETYFGDGAKTYAIEIANQMIGVDLSDDGYISADMQRGIDYEPVAIRAYEMKHMVSVHSRQVFHQHPELSFVGCHPDGVIGKNEAVKEVKCPNQTNHTKNVLYATQYHSDYYDQCQCEAFVLGAKRIVFVSFDDRFPDPLQLCDHEFPIDLEWQRLFSIRAKAFWDNEVMPIFNALLEKMKQSI